MRPPAKRFPPRVPSPRSAPPPDVRPAGNMPGGSRRGTRRLRAAVSAFYIVTVKGPICNVIRMASPPFGRRGEQRFHRHGNKNSELTSPLFLPYPRKRLAASAAGGASALIHRHGNKNRGPASPLFLPYPRKRLAASATGGASALSSCRCAARDRRAMARGGKQTVSTSGRTTLPPA